MTGAVVDTIRNRALDFGMSTIKSGVSFHADFPLESPEWEIRPICGLRVTRGRVRFIGSAIGTKFDAGGATFNASGSGRWPYVALDLTEVNITGTLFLGESQEMLNSKMREAIAGKVPFLSCKGTVVLRNSNIAGD